MSTVGLQGAFLFVCIEGEIVGHFGLVTSFGYTLTMPTERGFSRTTENTVAVTCHGSGVIRLTPDGQGMEGTGKEALVNVSGAVTVVEHAITYRGALQKRLKAVEITEESGSLFPTTSEAGLEGLVHEGPKLGPIDIVIS